MWDKSGRNRKMISFDCVWDRNSAGQLKIIVHFRTGHKLDFSIFYILQKLFLPVSLGTQRDLQQFHFYHPANSQGVYNTCCMLYLYTRYFQTSYRFVFVFKHFVSGFWLVFYLKGKQGNEKCSPNGTH